MTTAVVAPEPVFVDTNLLVYAAVPAFPLHVDARMRLTELEAAGVCLWISRQTLREYLSALSRPSAYSPPIPMTSLDSSFHEKLYNRCSAHTTPVAPAAPPRHRAFLAAAPSAGAPPDAR